MVVAGLMLAAEIVGRKVSPFIKISISTAINPMTASFREVFFVFITVSGLSGSFVCVFLSRNDLSMLFGLLRCRLPQRLTAGQFAQLALLPGTFVNR